LASTEAATRVGENRVPDDLYHDVRQQIHEKERADLKLAMAIINAWNRLAISARVCTGNLRGS